MGIAYGPTPSLFDHFDSLDQSKWNIHGLTFGNVTTNNSELLITNTTGTASDYIGINSIQTFSTGTTITVRSRSVSGRHHSLVGFGASPFFPFPHAGTVPGLTWYSRADNLSSTISWRNENGTTGFFNSATQNLTTYQIFKIVRLSSTSVQLWRNNVLEYTANGLILANNYSVYFSNDGHTKPNSSAIDYISVTTF